MPTLTSPTIHLTSYTFLSLSNRPAPAIDHKWTKTFCSHFMNFHLDTDSLLTPTRGRRRRDITRFFPRIDQIFPGEALNPFFGAQDEGFSEFRSR